MDDREDDDVAAALAILRDAGFPVERVRVLPAVPDGAGAGAEAGAAGDGPDRAALLDACLAILDGGEPWLGKDLAREIGEVGGRKVTRKDVNSVLTREGRDRVAYDRESFTYRLAR